MEEKQELKEGVKYDKDKLRVDLLPVIGLLRQADVYTRGAKKYSDHNWRLGMKWSRIIGAMIRHALWFAAGESIDPKDGQHHLSSVAWCANTLMEYEITHPELDDRYIPIPPEKLRELIEDSDTLDSKQETKETSTEPSLKELFQEPKTLSEEDLRKLMSAYLS